MENAENLTRQMAELTARADALEKRYDRIIGKAETYTPRTTSLMREGLPLEIFTRNALLKHDFQVFGSYPFTYYSDSRSTVERSVDIYAVRDSVYTVPDRMGKMAGRSWPERNHLLIEAKQRKAGVEWIFARKPTSFDSGSVAGDDVPIANSGFEIRPNETNQSNSPNAKDVNNAISQLNQAFLPFYIDLFSEKVLECAGQSWRYASVNEKDIIYLILVTNAKLRYFSPPKEFGSIEGDAQREEQLFPEVPWVVFKPERPPGLIFHQDQVLDLARKNFSIKKAKEPSLDRYDLLTYLSKLAHEVHIINFDHIDKVVELVKNPPRIERIDFTLSVEGMEKPVEFSIDGSTGSSRTYRRGAARPV